jgi:hypothetical protein
MYEELSQKQQTVDRYNQYLIWCCVCCEPGLYMSPWAKVKKGRAEQTEGEKVISVEVVGVKSLSIVVARSCRQVVPIR